VPARFSEDRVIPILDNPNEYELSIVRFSVPTNTIPIFIWPGDDFYKVTIEWRGVRKSAFMEFAGQGLTLYGIAIYHYQEICDSMNAALKNIFDQLSAEFPGPLPAPDWALYAYKPPFFVFSQELKQFQFIIPYTTPDYSTPPDGINEDEHWSSVIAPVDPLNEIKLFFNRNVEKFMSGFQFIGNSIDAYSDDVFRLVIQNTFNNVVQLNLSDPLTTQYAMNQTYSNLSIINDFENLIFRTSRIPIVNEFQGTQKNITRQILTDFVPLPGAFDASTIVYYPQGPLRHYPLITNVDFRSTDLQVFWENKQGIEFPVYLLPNRTLSVKIQFRKKPSISLDEVLRQGDQLE
jgi:hypothetical protein